MEQLKKGLSRFIIDLLETAYRSIYILLALQFLKGNTFNSNQTLILSFIVYFVIFETVNIKNSTLK